MDIVINPNCVFQFLWNPISKPCVQRNLAGMALNGGRLARLCPRCACGAHFALDDVRRTLTGRRGAGSNRTLDKDLVRCAVAKNFVTGAALFSRKFLRRTSFTTIGDADKSYRIGAKLKPHFTTHSTPAAPAISMWFISHALTVMLALQSMT